MGLIMQEKLKEVYTRRYREIERYQKMKIRDIKKGDKKGDIKECLKRLWIKYNNRNQGKNVQLRKNMRK